MTISGDVGSYTVNSEAASGYWKIALAHSSTWRTGGSGMRVTVQGATGPAVIAAGVQAGDVFFCAGQSNMFFTLHQSLNYTAEAATLANYPNFRFFMTNRALHNTPQFDLTTDDANCDAAVPPTPPAPPAPPAPVGCFPNAWIKDVAWKTGPGLGGVPAASAADCCAICGNSTMQKEHCKGWSWVPATQSEPAMCWLKTAVGGKSMGNKGGFSGGLQPPPDSCLSATFLNDTFYGHGHGPSIGSAPGNGGGDCCEQCSNSTWRDQGCRYFSFEPASAAVRREGGAAGAGTCWFKTSEHGQR